jgi:hypothetical protein
MVEHLHAEREVIFRERPGLLKMSGNDTRRLPSNAQKELQALPKLGAISLHYGYVEISDMRPHLHCRDEGIA